MPERRGKAASAATLLVARSLGVQSQWRRIRAVALACSTVMVLLSVVALGVVAACYDGRQLRADVRAPQMVDSASDSRAKLLWSHSFDAIGVKYFSVIYLHPLVDDAPLPPGLSTWPNPGEVLLSPAAIEEGKADGVETRFGSVVGTIGPEGLIDSGERLAYVVPPEATVSLDNMQAVKGFGRVDAGGLVGVMGYVQPMSWLMSIFGLFFVIPSLIFLTIAARMGYRERSHRGQILTALGATRADLAKMACQEAWRPMLMGTVFSLAVVVTAFFVDVPLPGVAFTLMAKDLLRWAPSLIAILAGTSLVTLVSVIATATSYRVGKRSVRPTPAPLRRRPVLAIASVATVVGIPAYVRFLIVDQDADAGLIPVIYLIGLIVIALTIRYLLAEITLGISSVARRVAWARGFGGTLIGAAKLRYDVQGTIPIAAALAVAVILVSQFQVQASIQSSDEIYAEQQFALLGNDFAYVTGGNSDATENLPAMLSTEYAWLRVAKFTEGEESFRLIVEISSTPENLQKFGINNLPVPTDRALLEHRLASALDLTSDDVVRVLEQRPEQGLDDEQDYSYLVTRNDGTEISIPQLKESVAASFAPMPNIRSVGESSRTGLWVATNHARWLSWSTIIGMMIFTISMGFGIFIRAKAAARELAAPAATVASHRSMIAALAWTAFIPLIVSSLLATVIAIYYGSPLLGGKLGAVLPDAFITASLTITSLLALSLWLISARWESQAASTWTTAATDNEN